MPSMIGTGANQVPTNGMLGTLAFQNAESTRVGSLKNDGVSNLDGKVTIGNPTSTLDVALNIAGEAAESPNGVPVKMLSQGDVGNAPEQVPLNGLLGELAYVNKDSFVITPTASATPHQKGSLVFQLTNDTTLTILAKGQDGVVRSVALVLA